jgi:hypothetical protein
VVRAKIENLPKKLQRAERILALPRTIGVSYRSAARQFDRKKPNRRKTPMKNLLAAGQQHVI